MGYHAIGEDVEARGFRGCLQFLQEKWQTASVREKVALVTFAAFSVIAVVAAGCSASDEARSTDLVVCPKDPCSAMINGTLVRSHFLTSNGEIPDFKNASSILKGSLHCLVHTTSSPVSIKKERGIEKTVPYVIYNDKVTALYIYDHGTCDSAGEVDMEKE